MPETAPPEAQDILTTLLEVWDTEDDDGGRDTDTARRLADQYVANNPTQFTHMEDWSLETCVASVEAFRAAGDLFRERGLDDQAVDASKLLVDVWLLHHFQPQQIGGSAAPMIRVTSNG